MKVAVLLSVYYKDRPDWFELALLSIIQQEFDGEIRIYLGVDGKLSPELASIIDKYKNQIFLVVRSDENLGLTKMLNRIIDKLCDEEFIFRTDADDINHPERFQKQIQFLLEHPEIDVVGTAIEEIDENNKVILSKVSYPKTHEACREFFKKRDPLAHPAVLFRRSYFAKAGKYNPAHRTNQDTYMWLSGFLTGCQFANLDEVLVSFRRSTDFYERRGGFKRAWQILKMKFEIARRMNYSFDAYVYSFLFFFFTLLPPQIKKNLYQRLR